MKSYAHWFLGLVLLAVPAIAEDQIQWAPDFRTACGMAAEQRRLVLLHFYNDNCGPCIRLEKNVFSRAEVGEAVAQNFVAVKVHAGKEPQLASRYRVNQWPTDVFVTPSGLEVRRGVSEQDPAKFIGVLHQVAQQTGIGNARQWKSPLDQVSQNAVAAASGAANATRAEFIPATQQASSDLQAAAERFRSQWNGATTQFQQAASQTQDAAQQSAQQLAAATQQTMNQAQQQATATVQQTADKASQWSQQASNAVQSYQQQAGESYRQFRQQAETTAQEVQQQVDSRKQTMNAAAQKTTQELTEAAQGLKSQFEQTKQSLLERRSAFMQSEQSPAAPALEAVAATQPAQAAADNSPTGAASPAASGISPTPPQPSSTAVVVAGGPQTTENPWVKVKQASSESSAQVAARAPTSSAPAAPPLLSATPSVAPPAAQPTFAPAKPEQAASRVSAAPALPAAPAPAPPVAGNRPLVPASQAPPIALDGFCPVTLLETMTKNPSDRAAWKKGDRQFGAIHRGRTYLFASAEQQQKFLSNPDAFAPALAGCDPVRYAERGEWVDGKRAYGIVTPDRRILLFADEVSRNRFEQSPANYTVAIQQAIARSESGAMYR